MPSCVVPGCSSGYKGISENRHFFQPPKDPIRLECWNKAIHRADFKLSNKHKICDLHFHEHHLVKMYIHIINGERVELPRGKWELTPDAVPEIFPNLPKYLTKNVKLRKPPTNRLPVLSSKVIPPDIDYDLDQNSLLVVATSTPHSPSKSVANSYKHKNFLLRKKIKNLRRQLVTSRNRCAQLESDLQKETNIKNGKFINISSFSDTEKDIVNTISTKHQVATANGMRYSDSFILESILLKIKSPKGYRHCINHNLLPLPSEVQLRRITKGLKCSYGINENAIKAISENLDSKKKENVGILIFDEVKLTEEINLNSQTLKVDGFVNYGNHTPEDEKGKMANHALVFMFVPLLKRWVQPVAVFAARNATPGKILEKLLIEIIIELENQNINIIAFTCDGCTTNKSMWKKLGIKGTQENINCSITNPVDQTRKIWAISDPVHIFKCIRNNFMAHGQVFYKDNEINFKFYNKLFSADRSPNSVGLYVCPKLSQAHVSPNSFQKMNVRLAFQLFSRSVAKGLEFYRTRFPEKFLGSEWTETFTIDMNDIIDCLNSITPATGLRKSSKQYLKVKQFLDNITDPEVKNNFASTTTMESLRVTLTSILEISDFLYDQGFCYILTRKFSQDPIERHFGILRSMSPDSHPSTIDFLHLHMLNSIYVPIKNSIRGSNIESNEHESPISRFVKNMRALSKETEENNKEIKTALNIDIGKKIVIGVEQIRSDGDNDPIVYYICGYVIKQASKFVSCLLCRERIKSECPVSSNLSFLTELREFTTNDNSTSLLHPSMPFFQLIKNIEDQIKNKLEEDLWDEIFLDFVSELKDIYVPENLCCCKEHIGVYAPKLIFYYIKCRFYFFLKSIRREIKSNSSSKNKRKLAHLY